MTMTTAVAAAVASALATAPAFAQGNPRGDAKLKVGGKTIAIDYGRPSLRGRDMLGQAQAGQDWRMGADAATTLKTEADLVFGNVTVPKGEYVLRARKVAEGRWQLNVVGSNDQTVAEIPLEGAKLDQSVEVFTIELVEASPGGLFRMSWGNQALSARFKLK
jgi:hypothetical protein